METSRARRKATHSAPQSREHTGKLTLRIFFALAGGYFLTSALTACGALVMSWLMPRADAVSLMTMLGFIIYLVVLPWGFTEPRLWRIGLVLGAGAVIGQSFVFVYKAMGA